MLRRVEEVQLSPSGRLTRSWLGVGATSIADFLNDGLAPDLSNGFNELAREIVRKIDVAGAIKRAIFSNGCTERIPCGTSKATKVLIDFCAGTVLRTNHQRPDSLRHSILQKLPKLPLANQELLPEGA